jgi:enoyl-CoA hydratase
MSWTIERQGRVAVVTKRACQAAALRDIVELADPLDDELPDGMTSDQARHAHRRYWQQLKGSLAPW